MTLLSGLHETLRLVYAFTSHNPTNATDHLPFVEKVVEQFALLCQGET